MGPIGCPKTSVKNCHLQAGDYEMVDLSVHTNIPKEQNDMEEMCSSGLTRVAQIRNLVPLESFAGPQKGTYFTSPFWRLEYY